MVVRETCQTLCDSKKMAGDAESKGGVTGISQNDQKPKSTSQGYHCGSKMHNRIGTFGRDSQTVCGKKAGRVEKAAEDGIIRGGRAGTREWNGRWTGEAGRRSRWAMGHRACLVQGGHVLA